MKYAFAPTSLVLISFAASTLAASAFAAKAPKPDISGEWKSEICESMPNGQGGETFFKRHFWNTKKDWKIHFTTFGDKDCTTELVQVEVAGPYKLQGASKSVEGGTEGFFTTKTRKVTAKSEGALGWLNGSSVCGAKDWKVGEAKDISKSGCAELGAKPWKDCKGENDVVKLDGGKLFFGDRSGDLCKTHPTKLHANALAKL